MNPVSQIAQKAGQTMVRDVSPPKTQSMPAQAQASASLTAEIVRDIPIRKPIDSVQPAKPQPADNPVIHPTEIPVGAAKEKDDKELDKILQDVNTSVKSAENSNAAQFGHMGGVRQKAAAKKAKMGQGREGPPPILATVAACLVALILSVSAVLLFKHSA